MWGGEGGGGGGGRGRWEGGGGGGGGGGEEEWEWVGDLATSVKNYILTINMINMHCTFNIIILNHIWSMDNCPVWNDVTMVVTHYALHNQSTKLIFGITSPHPDALCEPNVKITSPHWNFTCPLWLLPAFGRWAGVSVVDWPFFWFALKKYIN